MNRIDPDSFRMSDNVERKLKQLKTDAVVIPGGLTPIVQPLDMSINSPTSGYVHQQAL